MVVKISGSNLALTMKTKICNLLLRRKILSKKNHNENSNHETLYNNDLDLLAFGVNSTLSFGFYIVIGFLVITYAGRAAIFSVLVASILAIISGLCYAEFGARIREEASSYIYAYVCLGEIIAFIIGWIIILEFVTGLASLCRALTCYIDFISDEKLINTFQQVLTINIDYFSTYIDFVAMGVSILIPIILLLPIISSMKINKALLVFNIILCIVLIVTGATKVDVSNWKFVTNDVETNNAFFSFGKDNILKGILICFCAFVSPEFICMSRKGLRNVNKNTLNPMIFSICVIALCMIAMCIVITLMIPDLEPILLWKEQNIVSFMAYIFKYQQINIIWASWLAGIGGIIEICCSIYFISVLLPNFLDEMVSDSLLFKFLSKKCKNTNYGTFFISIITGLAGAFFSSKLLINLLALGIVLTCTTVAISVLILRYTDGRLQKEEFLPSEMKSDSLSNFVVCKNRVTLTDLCNQVFNKNGVRSPTPVTSLLVKIDVLLLCIFSVLLNFCFVLGEKKLYEGKIWIICVISILAVLILITLISISFQPSGSTNLSFVVPMLPYIPTIFIFVNIYLMLWLDYVIWIAFAVWIVCGLCIYFICFKIYKRYNENSLITLNRTVLNGKMNFAYENQIHFEEVESVHGENSVIETNIEINNIQTNQETAKHNSTNNISNEENLKEKFTEDIKYEQKVNNHIRGQEPAKEYQQGRASSATHVLAMLDEILSHENSEDPDDILLSNISKMDYKRKISVETESSNSLPLATEHLALVHCEDEQSNTESEINKNTEETSGDLQDEKNVNNEISSLNEINIDSEELNVPDDILKTEEVVTDENILSEIEDTTSVLPSNDEIKNSLLFNELDNEEIRNMHNIYLDHIYVPKTPNVSRAESFLRHSLTSNNNDPDFVNKLNQVLQEQLEEKPRKKGFYKQENYEEEENERDEIKLPETNSLLALIHKEMKEKHKLISQKSNENGNENENEQNNNTNEKNTVNESAKANDIREKLELIFQNMIAEQKLKSTVKKPIHTDENAILNKNYNQENVDNEKNKNDDICLNNNGTSDITNENVNINKNDNKVSLLEDKIQNTESLDQEQNIKNKDEENVEHNENESKNVASIKEKLNEIFSRGPQHHSQVVGIRKHLSAPSLVEMEQSFEMDIDDVVFNEPPPPPKPISKTLNKETHKTLMNNVFKSIELRRNSSSRNEGSFLTKLQQQNEKLKRNSVLPMST